MIDIGRDTKRWLLEGFLSVRPVPRALWISILILMASCLVLPEATGSDDTYRKMINCDLHKGSCSQLLEGKTVMLTVTPRPVKAMTDLVFEVVFEIDPALDIPPFIDLAMPGMNMGQNQVVLESKGKGVYKGTGVIVRCKSGRRTWRATLTCPGMGSTDFIFDVIY